MSWGVTRDEGQSSPLAAAGERDAEHEAQLWSSEMRAPECSSAATSEQGKFKLSIHGTSIYISLLLLLGNPPCKLDLTGAVAC